MSHNIYIYIFVMAGVTYLIRMLPLVLAKKEISNPFIKSFLYYVPYACLAAMTFPAILFATESPVSGAAGLGAALIAAYKEKVFLQLLWQPAVQCLWWSGFYSLLQSEKNFGVLLN